MNQFDVLKIFFNRVINFFRRAVLKIEARASNVVVVLSLLTNRCVGAVAAKDGRLLRQAEELVFDAVNLRFEVAAGQVGSPDAPLKKRVATKQELGVCDIK